jgi:hypothetical protein
MPSFWVRVRWLAMLGSALYYPFVDVRDRRWLRSAILFWDKIQTIVPSSISEPYHNPDTRICEQEGYLEPLRCELHQDVLDTLGKRIINLSEHPYWLSDLYRHYPQNDPSFRALQQSDCLANDVAQEFHWAGIYPEKMAPELRNHLIEIGLGHAHRDNTTPQFRNFLMNHPRLSRLRPDKLSHELKRLLGLRAEYDGEWFIVDSRFAGAYMAALAAMLAAERKLSPLTTQESYQGLNLRCFIDDVGAAEPSDARGALLTLVMEGLRIDPNTPITKLLAFRRARANQLAELSALFDDFKSKIEKSEEGELAERAKRIFRNNIRPGLEKLKKELADQSIQSAWKGFYQAATFSAGGGALLAEVAVAAPATVVALGAFLTVTNVAVNSIFARRKVRATSPYTYLLDIEKEFSAPVWA